jgi:hypothetical protein
MYEAGKSQGMGEIADYGLSCEDHRVGMIMHGCMSI